MIREVKFESQDRRINQILAALNEYGIKSIEEANEICGYEFIHMGKFMDEIKKGTDANEALKKVTGTYGRFTAEQGAVKHIDPRHE